MLDSPYLSFVQHHVILEGHFHHVDLVGGQGSAVEGQQQITQSDGFR